MGNGAGAHQILPAVCSDFGDVQISLGGIQVCSGLLKLLVEFRRFDLREQLPFLNMRPNIEIPTFEIATGSRVNGGVAKRLRVARQDDLLQRRAFLRRHNGNGGDSRFFCSLF